MFKDKDIILVIIFDILLAFVDNTFALTPPPATGETPPPISCPDQLCNGKVDGNYQINANEHYFVQCVNGMAHCQPCWPLYLVFKEKCNQCLYSQKDECQTTQKWKTIPTYFCPDSCAKRGPDFSGNKEDAYNPYHYVACWKGITIGCVRCPAGLKFNEKRNACLYEGEFKTESQHAKQTNNVYDTEYFV